MTSTADADDESMPAGQGRRRPRSVARNIAALLLSQSITWALATAVLWVMPRYLGAAAIGQFRLATSIATIVGVFAAWGSGGVVIVEVAKDPRATHQLIRRTIVLRLALFLAAVPVVAALAVPAGYDRTTLVVIALALGGLLVGLVYGTYQSALHGLQEMGATSRVEVLSKTLATMATFGVLVAGAGVIELSIANIVLNGIALVLIVVTYGRVRTPVAGGGDVVLPALLRVGFPFLLADASLVLYQQIDTIVMSFLVDDVAIGWYAAADVLFGSLLFVPTIVMTAAFPAIAELHARDPDQAQRALERAYRSMFVIAVPMGVGAVVVSKPFVDFLYGSEFAPAADVLAVYGVVTVLTCQTIVLGRYALATGRARFWALLMVSVTALSIPLDLVLVPWTDREFQNGAIGGALAYVVTEAVLTVVGVVRLAPTILDRAFAVRLGKCLLGAAAMVAAGWPLRERFFLVSFFGAGLAYLVVVVATRMLTSDERDMIRSARHRLTGRLGGADLQAPD